MSCTHSAMIDRHNLLCCELRHYRFFYIVQLAIGYIVCALYLWPAGCVIECFNAVSKKNYQRPTPFAILFCFFEQIFSHPSSISSHIRVIPGANNFYAHFARTQKRKLSNSRIDVSICNALSSSLSSFRIAQDNSTSSTYFNYLWFTNILITTNIIYCLPLIWHIAAL